MAELGGQLSKNHSLVRLADCVIPSFEDIGKKSPSDPILVVPFSPNSLP